MILISENDYNPILKILGNVDIKVTSIEDTFGMKKTEQQIAGEIKWKK